MTKQEIIERLKEIIQVQQGINREYHGRPDCKNCSMQEMVEALIESEEST